LLAAVAAMTSSPRGQELMLTSVMSEATPATVAVTLGQKGGRFQGRVRYIRVR